MSVAVDDVAARMLGEAWLRQKLRFALEIESRDDADDLGGGVWWLGDSARSIVRLRREPALLDRARVARGNVQAISP